MEQGAPWQAFRGPGRRRPANRTIPGVTLFDGHPHHPDAPSEGDAPPPHALEAEHAVLGALLFDNDALVDVDGVVEDRDFFEPFHQRLFRAITRDIRAGRLAEPSQLAQYFIVDGAFAEFGGTRYLIDLMDKAPPRNQAGHYAKVVRSVALRREVARIASEIAIRATTDGDADGATLMADLERELIGVRQGKTDLSLRPFGEVAREVCYGMDRPEARPMLKLGIAKLDKLLGGAELGDMIVLGGRPGMGKSALAGCLALNVAMAGLGVAEINAEMTVQQMARRHLTDLAFSRYGHDAPFYRAIREGTCTEPQRRMIGAIQAETEKLPLYMIKRTGLTLGRVRAMIMRQKMIWESIGIPLRLVVVDHVGLITPDKGGRSRLEDQTIVSGALKELADELGVVMLALAQLNRQVEMRDDKRPMLADLRDSGSWEQDADVVIGCYRDAYYARREREPKGDLKVAEWVMRCSSPIVEAIGLKVREGDVGTAKLWASIGHNAIRDEAPFDASDPFAKSPSADLFAPPSQPALAPAGEVL